MDATGLPGGSIPPSRLDRFGDWDSLLWASDAPANLGEFRPFFGGKTAYDRMAHVRRAIHEIRTRWDEYDRWMAELRQVLGPVGADHDSVVAKAFEGRLSWSDDPASGGSTGFNMVRLYTSDYGYQSVFSKMNKLLRASSSANNWAAVRAAVFLVELLTIDLYNYRQKELTADDFNGVVYRGMRLSSADVEALYGVLRESVSGRYISVPLSLQSASRDADVARAFALGDSRTGASWHSVVWAIDVHSLSPRLLSAYRSRYPRSVVTSICAVPLEALSSFREREVLLRGAHMQLVDVRPSGENAHGNPVHVVDAVSLNTNRDHLTAVASDQGEDKIERDLFRSMVVGHRSAICARRAEQLGRVDDADAYRKAADENRLAYERALG